MKKSQITHCTIEGCDRKYRCSGLCKSHYDKLIRYGDPLYTRSPIIRTGCITKKGKGYKVFKINGQRVYEHRAIMEQKIVRPLEKDERVHHIDGNKLNNAPENLELTTKSEHARHHGEIYKKTYKKDYSNGKYCSLCSSVRPLSAFLFRLNKHGEYRPRSWCNSCEKQKKRLSYKSKKQAPNIEAILELRSRGFFIKDIAQILSMSKIIVSHVIHGTHWSQRKP